MIEKQRKKLAADSAFPTGHAKDIKPIPCTRDVVLLMALLTSLNATTIIFDNWKMKITKNKVQNPVSSKRPRQRRLAQAQKELEHQTEEYYCSLSKTGRKEDRQWSKISARSAKHLWDK